MRKSTVFSLLICFVFAFSGCYLDVEYEFFHDTSEIDSIEIVKISETDSEKLHYEEKVLATVENIDMFLQEFSEIHCREIFNDPCTIEPNITVLKVTYLNGDYEYIDYIAQRKCYKDSLRSHNGYFILDKEPFEALIKKYTKAADF